MKNLLRAFAFSLVITGAVASVHTTSNNLPTPSGKLSSPPMPMCPPDDPNACGFGSSGK